MDRKKPAPFRPSANILDLPASEFFAEDVDEEMIADYYPYDDEDDGDVSVIEADTTDVAIWRGPFEPPALADGQSLSEADRACLQTSQKAAVHDTLLAYRNTSGEKLRVVYYHNGKWPDVARHNWNNGCRAAWTRVKNHAKNQHRAAGMKLPQFPRLHISNHQQIDRNFSSCVMALYDKPEDLEIESPSYLGLFPTEENDDG